MNKKILIIIFSFNLLLKGENQQLIKSSIKTAKMLEKKDQFNSAISIYTDLLIKNPTDRQVLRNLKLIYKKQNLYLEAIKFFELRIINFPNDFNNYSTLGEFLYLNNQKLEAKSIWDSAIIKFNNQRSFYREILSIYSKFGLDEEIQNLLSYGRSQFHTSFLSYEAGIYYQTKGAYDKSMDQYLLNLLNEPEQNGIIERRILLMSDEESAIPIIKDKLIKASKKNSNLTLNLLSEFYFKQQNYSKAFETKLTWAKLGNNNLDNWFKFANQLREENQFKYSIDAYNYILEHKLHSNLMGKALFGLAKTFEKQILPMNEIDIIPYFFDNNIFFDNPFLSVSKISTENLKTSLNIYDSLLITLPNSPLLSEVYFRLGEIQYRILHDFDQAQTFFNKAIQNKPNKKLKIKILERITDVMISKGHSKETIAFIDRKLNNENIQKLKRKKILIYFLTSNPDTTIKAIDELLPTISPSDKSFNDLMELKNLLISYYKNDPQNTKAFKHFLNAEWYLRQQKLTNALSELNYIKNNFPNTNIIPLINLRVSLLYYRLKEFDKSLMTAKLLNDTIFEDRGIILSGQIYEYKFFDLNKAKSQYMRIINNHNNSIFSEPIRYHIRRINKEEI